MRRNVFGETGNTRFAAAIFVEPAVFRVLGHQQLVVHAFGRHEHQRVIERVFVGQNIFFRDGIGVLADGQSKNRAARRRPSRASRR